MSENSKLIPTDGVSKKLKTVVIILTALTLVAFVALFAKLATKQPLPAKPLSTPQISSSSQTLVAEYQAVGTRLMNSGLTEQAIDQFIKIWELQKMGSIARAEAAQAVGRLYMDLDNCQEALVWLFRAEHSDSEKPLTPHIDTCMTKVRNNFPSQ